MLFLIPSFYFIELLLDSFHLFRVGQKLIRRESHGLAGEDRCLPSLFRTRRFPHLVGMERHPIRGRFEPQVDRGKGVSHPAEVGGGKLFLVSDQFFRDPLRP